jgi:hypothetical protein
VTVPSTINVAANGTYTFDITVDASTVPIGEVRHAWINFKDVASVRRLRFPITIVRKQSSIPITKSCVPTAVPLGTTTDCTIEITNLAFAPANVDLSDVLPSRLKLVPGSVANATVSGNGLTWSGTLSPATPPVIDVAIGSAPFGYVSLASLGLGPLACTGTCDDTAFNFGTGGGGVLYNGVVYSTAGLVTNGFVQLGGATSTTSLNQNLPNPAAPNAVLAPFWTDLWPAGTTGAGSGTLRAAVLSSGGNSWLVFEWTDVREFASATSKYTFQVWMRRGGLVEDITFAYARVDSTGSGGLLTVGAENADGSIGDSYYFNGVGTLPGVGTELRVSSAAIVPGGTRTVTFSATGKTLGNWTNCAKLTSDQTLGTSSACISGSVVP